MKQAAHSLASDRIHSELYKQSCLQTQMLPKPQNVSNYLHCEEDFCLNLKIRLPKRITWFKK